MKVTGLVLGSLVLSTSAFALDCWDYVRCSNQSPDTRYETQRQLETFRDQMRHEAWMNEYHRQRLETERERYRPNHNEPWTPREPQKPSYCQTSSNFPGCN